MPSSRELGGLAQPASRTAISRAVRAAGFGISTTITASSWMTVERAFFLAMDLLDEDGDDRQATAYVTGNALYIGPRKVRAPSSR
jgi:hypothetical protein